MEKKFLTVFTTGFFLIGMSATSQALTISGEYNALFGNTPPNLPAGFAVEAVISPASPEAVYDTGGELIGYIDLSADPVFTGIYIGTVTDTPAPGNGSQMIESEVETLVAHFLNVLSFNAEVYLKVDGASGAASTSGGTVTLTTTATPSLTSGTWTVTDIDPFKDYGLSFYGVKSSTDVALYYVDPAISSGKWSTVHLLNKQGLPQGISHFGGVAESTAIVPEPTTMLLFGAGLAGLAAVGRRRKNV